MARVPGGLGVAGWVYRRAGVGGADRGGVRDGAHAGAVAESGVTGRLLPCTTPRWRGRVELARAVYPDRVAGVCIPGLVVVTQ